MKVLLVNGSPHKEGCTYTALCEIAKTLNEENIETEIFNVGTDAVSGCLGCKRCATLGKCFINDVVNEFVKKAHSADGFIFGSPVHYASASGAITSFMDRVFYCGKQSGVDPFYLKPATCIVSARRGGTTAAMDQLNKYFTITQMPIISSRYWNMVHGNSPKEVLQDKEGLQTMRILARNMAWFLRCKKAGEDAGVPLPKKEDFVFTNFIK